MKRLVVVHVLLCLSSKLLQLEVVVVVLWCLWRLEVVLWCLWRLEVVVIVVQRRSVSEEEVTIIIHIMLLVEVEVMTRRRLLRSVCERDGSPERRTS